MAHEPVPLLDLKPQYQSIREEIQAAIERVLDAQQFILGPEVAKFEEELARYCQTEFCIGVSSGSDALIVTLMALGIGPGDEVITSPYTFFSTAGAIARVGAKPVFVDIDPVTYNIQPESIDETINSRTKAIIPVHLYGQCADMDPINEIATSHGLWVIEDAAQAIGAESGDRRAGSLGTAGCFSFFPSKNLGAFGDAGAVTTNDPELAEKIRCLRMHGAKSEYQHENIGGNFRLDALHAAVLRVKLGHLDLWTNSRQMNAMLYENAFEECGIPGSLGTTPKVVGTRHVFNQYIIRTSDRDAVRKHLTDHQIGSKVYYHTPLHLLPCFGYLGYQEGDLPESELAGRSTIALPIYPELTVSQIHRVTQTIADYFDSLGRLPQRQAA